MEFCINCGKPVELNKNIKKCSCGFTNVVNSKTSFTEEIKKQDREVNGVLILEKFKEGGFPHKCKKCGYEYADVTDLGSSWADESNIYLFKCKKCGNVTRDAYGSQ